MADPEATNTHQTGPETGPRTGASMLYVTCASVNDARAIARTLIGERLAACANIIEGMHSVYRWQGEIAEDEETVLLLKTSADRVVQAIDRVRALHDYDVPCIVELPLAGGNPAFLDWIADETAAPTDD